MGAPPGPEGPRSPVGTGDSFKGARLFSRRSPEKAFPFGWPLHAALVTAHGGVSDPQDLDDAALAAARYLCTAGGDLATGAGWVAAVRAYNHADAYVRAVYAAASAYATRTAPD